MEIVKGQKFECSEDVTLVQKNRVIEVVDEKLDEKGRVLVRSENNLQGTKRLIKINAKRLLSSSYRVIALLILALLVGCAGSPRVAAKSESKTVCNEQVQWIAKDDKGNDLGIYICFGDNSQLQYQVRILPKKTFAPVASTGSFSGQADHQRTILKKALSASKHE